MRFKGKFRVESYRRAFGLFGYAANRRPTTRASGYLLPFLATNFNGNGYLGVFTVLSDHLGDPFEKTFFHPIHNKAVGSKQAKIIPLVHRLQRLNPGAELLCGKLAFELVDALLPDRGAAHVNYWRMKKGGSSLSIPEKLIHNLNNLEEASFHAGFG